MIQGPKFRGSTVFHMVCTSSHYIISSMRGVCWRRERDLNSRGNGPTRFPVARTTRLCDLGSCLAEPHSSFNHHPMEGRNGSGGAKGLKGADHSLSSWPSHRIQGLKKTSLRANYRSVWQTWSWPVQFQRHILLLRP